MITAHMEALGDRVELTAFTLDNGVPVVQVPGFGYLLFRQALGGGAWQALHAQPPHEPYEREMTKREDGTHAVEMLHKADRLTVVIEGLMAP